MTEQPSEAPEPELEQGPLKLHNTFTFVVSRAGDVVNICAIMNDPESHSVIPETGENALRLAVGVVGSLLNNHNSGTLVLADAVVKGHAMNAYRTKEAPKQH